MSKEKKIYKPKSVSGFPEWLPEVRRVEQQWFDHIRRVFESYGFCSIETPSIEELDVLRAKGEVDKEIYVLERLHKEEDDDSDARLALHFDQTVPLARYVAQHFNDLIFPFKRYQMQRVWRGERPQAGRFREFYQCDIDVINVDALPLHFDAEMPAIIWEVLNDLPGMEGENIQLRVSNRKILIGMCECLGITNIVEVTRIIDKLEKIGEQDAYADLLELGLNDEQLALIIEISSIKSSPSEISGLLRDFIARNDVIARSGSDEAIQTFNGGVAELETVMDQLKHLPEDAVIADLSIVRGLDYYTGTVYETVFTDDPGYGSICSGGRYDDLAGSYINKALPGVGISIGFSRLFDRLRQKGAFDVTRKSAADILMVLPNEEQRAAAAETARTLRERGYNVELYHAAQKIKKQMSYAERKGIPYVWFPPFEAGQDHEVKCMETGGQTKADPQNWEPRKEERDAAVA
ncbi:MAG: histidine--tRNA ligase [Rhodospirillales bacterium]|nr:histidine--tRNA ligase [Rhodospirillales bacterium]MCB9995908.1 histidine--tRNA ligase [Rhodospirillales bacterium]